MKKNSLIGPIIAIFIPLILFESYRSGLIEDHTHVMPKEHFYFSKGVAM